MLELLAGAAHMLVAAAWFGAMAYSLAVVQPRAVRFLADERRSEDFAAVLAAGARYSVLVLVAVLALSGAGLVAVGADDGRSNAWWALVAAKGVLLAISLAVFAYVSWRLWPARLFAGPRELPAIRARFRLAAYTLTGLVAAALVLSAAAIALR